MRPELTVLCLNLQLTKIEDSLFYTKMQKRHIPKMRFAFLISKNTSIQFLAKRKIFNRYQRSENKKDSGIAGPVPKHNNEHTNEFDLRYRIL